MSGDVPESTGLKRPRLTANGVWRGVVEIAPIAAFVMPFGIAFGVAASAKGIAPGLSVLMSLAIYAGASQFAARTRDPAPRTARRWISGTRRCHWRRWR